MTPLLQSTKLDCYTSDGANLLGCALSDMGLALGGDFTFGILVAGTVLLVFYLASDGGIATPAVLTALSGGIMFPVLPSEHQTIAMTIVFFGLTAAVLASLKKYVMTPGVR